MMRIVAFVGLLLMSLGASAQDLGFSETVEQAKLSYQAGHYAEAGQRLSEAFVWRSPRTEELLLAMRAWTAAEEYDQALNVLEIGVNSGWLGLNALLTDSLLRPLHPTEGWQTSIRRLIDFTNGTDEELREQLSKIGERDQFYRRQMQEVAREKGWQDPTVKEMYGLQRELDLVNVRELVELIEFYGFPTRSLVGNQANVALSILQRADLDTQLQYLPAIEAAAKENEVMRSELAYMIDQIRVAQELPQVYGTQVIRSSSGMLEFYRVEAPERINERRRAADLLPIEDYAAKVRVPWE